MNEFDQPTTKTFGTNPAPATPGATTPQGTGTPAKGSAQEVKRTAEEVAEKAKATAREAGERVSQEVSAGAEKLKQHGRDILDQQKARVGSEVRTCSDAIRRAADKLDAESDTNLAGYATSAADHIEQLGRRIEQASVGDLVDDVEGMARRRPEVFFGGMFVAGLAAARFLKASRRERRRESRTNVSPRDHAYRAPVQRPVAPVDPMRTPPSPSPGYSTPSANPLTGGAL